MKNHKIGRAAWGLWVMVVAVLSPLAAQAQATNDKWQWELAIYGWFPASDVIDALKMVFMGQAEVRKDRWGLWTDLVYADLGGSKGGSRNFTVDGHPVSVNADLSLDVKSTVWTLAGLYNLSSTPENNTDLLFGARMLNMKQTLNWSLATAIPELPTRSGQASVDGTDWDAIVGLKGRYYFGAERKW